MKPVTGHLSQPRPTAAPATILLALFASAAQAQTITPPNAAPSGGQWAYTSPHTQQLSGSFNVTRFRLMANAGSALGASWHDDMLMELESPNGVRLLIGGDFGTPMPGSVRWDDPSLAGVGTVPASVSNPMTIDATFSYNFGPVHGLWKVNFRNHYTSGGAIPWDNIQIVPCAPGICPEPGACCLPGFVCSQMMPELCASQGGVYLGGGVACGQCPPPVGHWNELGEAGELPATAQTPIGEDPTNPAEPLQAIHGTIDPNTSVDMFQITICDPTSFSASTLNGAAWDTILSLYDEQGRGVSYNDDAVGTASFQSRLTSQHIPGPGNYYIAIAAYPRHPTSVSGRIWADNFFRAERTPDGEGHADPVTGWAAGGVSPGAAGAYTIAFTGACFVSQVPACYANCDGSAVLPVLNVDDFTCFINEFAAAQALPHEQQVGSYPNCDLSTTAPVLNVDDFTCFINTFAVGCP